MSKKYFKRFAAFTMAAVLTAGSAMTVFAAENTVSVEGTGTYEGKDGEKPLVSITLPTNTDLDYGYIADPNNLIGQVADNGSLGSSVTVNTNAGILFKSGTDEYSGTSKKVEVTSENYQDVDITVELKVKDDAKGDADIVYADSEDFGTGDTASKEKKLYLAITDAADSDAKTAVLPASGSVKLTQTAEGKTDNYTLKYDSTNSKYVYEVNGSATGWNKVGFALTGAINKNAEWGEDVTFPTLVVTWSFAEHTDAVEAAAIMAAGSSIAVRLVSGQNAEAAKITSVKVDGTATTQYSVAASGAILINGVVMTSNHSIEVVHDGTTYIGTFTAQ